MNKFSEKDFTDISIENQRHYYFPDGTTITINKPRLLHVSKSGGHRIVDSQGNGHYIPSGWRHLWWSVCPNFDFPFVM